MQALEELFFFYGVGALILFVAAVALGRLSVQSVRDVAAAERRAARADTVAQVEAETEMPATTAPANDEPPPRAGNTR